MKRHNIISILAIIAFLGVLWWSPNAHCQKIQSLDKGDIAKFDGFLLDHVAFAEMKVAASTVQALADAKLETELAKQKANHDFAMATEKANNNFLKKENTLIEQERDLWMKRSKPSLWEKIDFPVGLSIGTVATYYIVTLLIKSTEEL